MNGWAASLWAAIREVVGDPLVNRRAMRRNAHLRMFDNAAVVEAASRQRAGTMRIETLWFPRQASVPASAAPAR